MKRFFKVLIPLVLAIVIIFCIGWYLFTYDRDFTRDVLLTGARYCESNGHTTLSAWFYDRAYDLAKDNDAVAIELAQQHKAAGNYTQAESTLTRAIEDGGGVDLYIALCKTYIEQDKILDAVKLLGGITNPETKAALDALRPAAPQASPAPGFYNQYISVSITGEGGTLYAHPVAEYPSIHDEPYSEPIVLVDGENTIYAVVVADNGLVSPLAVLGYTVGGVVEPVTFADPAVEQSVRQILEVGQDEVIMSNQLWTITSFTVPEGTTTLADLKHMLYLEELVVHNCPSGELSHLASHTQLVSLEIVDTPLSSSDLECIGSLTALETLTLQGCSIATTTALADLTQLTYLDLSNNTILNIDALAGMDKLTYLNLHQNALTDLSSLSGLPALKELNVSNNILTSLSPVLSITSLTWLDASGNQLTEVNNMDLLSNLSYLSVAENLLTDVSPLASCTSLTELNIARNYITDITMLNTLTGLVTLNFSSNQVTAIPEFPTDCALVTIDGSYNQITTLKPLAGLHDLNTILMDYNAEISKLDWLADNHTLIMVSVYGTKVNDMTKITCLTDNSIIVNFTPIQED